MNDSGVERVFEEYDGDRRNRLRGRARRIYTEVLPYFRLLPDSPNNRR